MNPNARIPVGILGATGSVGQAFVERLATHPWFEVTALAASARSVGRRYADAVQWRGTAPLDPAIGERTVEACAPGIDAKIVFSALDASVAEATETAFAEAGYVVVSNAKSHRMADGVPLLVPEVNPDHLALIDTQPFGEGAIITNPNCAVIGVAMALAPLVEAFGVDDVHVVTMQALSGAGYPGVSGLDVVDNIVPFIVGEEDKVETEPGKIFARRDGGRLRPHTMRVSASCTRVPVLDGHLACVSVRLTRDADAEAIVSAWDAFRPPAAVAGLPSAPERPIRYAPDDAFPQPRLHRDADGGMAVSIGRLRPCPLLGWKFVVLVHNIVRGAAGCAILNAELLARSRRMCR